MKAKCAAEVRAAAGERHISDAKLKAIDEAMQRNMSEIARQDRQRWLGLSSEQRVAEAVKKAMEEIQAEAALKEYTAGLQVLKSAAADARIADQMQRGGAVTRSQALARDAQYVENTVHAIRNESVAQLGDLLDAASSKQGAGPVRKLGMALFGLDNPDMTADVVREVFKLADGHTGNTVAKQAAKAWLDVIEGMRQRFNAAGGNIGKLGYGYLTQAHDYLRVRGDGGPEARDAWINTAMPLVDRSQYVMPDGSLMNDDALREVLAAAWQTLSTNGANKFEPGQFAGAGSRAKRGSDHRVLHFKDGDAWMAYMNQYGEGSLYDAMVGHIGKMARDIGLVEAYGPNANQTFRIQADIADRLDNTGDGRSILASRAQGNKPQAYWELISGNAGAAENRTLSFIGQTARNIQTAAKITAGPLAAFGDMATIATTLHFNRLPYFEMIANVGRQFSAEQRTFLREHGVIAESLTNDMQRMVGEHFTHNLSGQVTNAVMRLSLLNAWTDGLRGAFAATLMRNFSSKAGKTWAELDAWDQQLFARKGITEADWSVISKAKLAQRGGRDYLTANGILETGDPGAQAAATKWLAFVNDETQFAVVNPDLATRAIVTGGATQAGTWTGEAWRSFFQFKSFPVAMLTRHWSRIMDTPQGLEGAPAGFRGDGPAGEVMQKIAMLAAFGVTATIMGGIQTQGRQIAAGKDPIDMTGEHAAKFWTKAYAAGGGGGFFADVLLAPMDDPSYGFEGKLGLAGPLAGAGGGLIDVALAEKNQGARAIKWLNDQLPGVDIWYLRAIWEHWALYNAQEAINPGYLGRMQQRARKQWGQDFWWAPNDALPERAPDLSGAFGQ
ncbi:MAG: hypothetical protein ACRCV9_19095 [Burkholderiaceae bacterium]